MFKDTGMHVLFQVQLTWWTCSTSDWGDMDSGSQNAPVTLTEKKSQTPKQKHSLLTDAIKATVRVSGAERFQPTLCKSMLIYQHFLLRSRKQRLVMRQNNETMLARHTPHSTHCLKRLNSLNCLIKSVKTLQTVIKLTIVFLLCSHKLSSLVCLNLSLTLNIAIIYCSFTVRWWYFSWCSLAVNIHSSYLFVLKNSLVVQLQ